MPNQFTPKRPIFIPIGPSIAYVPLTNEQFAVIEIEDVIRVQQRSWNSKFDKNSKFYYAYSQINKKMVSLHRFLMNHPENHVDHKNRQTLDCRRLGNLRTASRSQNALNSKDKGNLSGLKGVSFRNSKWKATIIVNGKNHYLGVHDTPELAHQAYKEAAIRLAGEFARFE